MFNIDDRIQERKDKVHKDLKELAKTLRCIADKAERVNMNDPYFTGTSQINDFVLEVNTLLSLNTLATIIAEIAKVDYLEYTRIIDNRAERRYHDKIQFSWKRLFHVLTRGVYKD